MLVGGCCSGRKSRWYYSGEFRASPKGRGRGALLKARLRMLTSAKIIPADQRKCAISKKGASPGSATVL